jgi:hypothetical protein
MFHKVKKAYNGSDPRISNNREQPFMINYRSVLQFDLRIIKYAGIYPSTVSNLTARRITYG